MLVSFKNWNIITSSEEVERVHQFLLYFISDNMSALVQTYKYGAISTIDTTTMG